MTGIDIAKTFIKHAMETEEKSPLGIQYKEASAVRLPFPEETFDFATAFMTLQDIPEQKIALKEAFRVLKPGGFFQFSITHPCFQTPKLSSWLNLLIETGFTLEKFAEPTPDDETLKQHPDLYDARIVAYFLIIRCRK